jgi:hypothetical protein
LVGKRERKRQFGRPECGWENHIRMDHREVGWEGVEWIHLAYDVDHWWNLANTIMNVRVP